MLRYRRKNTVKIFIYRLPPKLTVKKRKTVYRQKLTVMLRYRPVHVRQKYRYRTPPCFFSLSGVLFPREYTTQLNETVKHDIRESDRHDRLYVHSLVCLAHLQNDMSC